MRERNWKGWILSIAIALLAGLLGNVLAGGTAQSYETMYQPPLAPPAWLFPIVWTALYVLMGTAAYLVYTSGGENRTTAIGLYAAQLIVNVLWPLLFFRWDAYWAAFFWLILLWILIVATIYVFQKKNKLAGKLLIPYLLWVTFAGYLNLAIALNS